MLSPMILCTVSKISLEISPVFSTFIVPFKIPHSPDASSPEIVPGESIKNIFFDNLRNCHSLVSPGMQLSLSDFLPIKEFIKEQK